MEGEQANTLNRFVYNVGTGLTSLNSFVEDGSLFDDPLQTADASTVQRYEYIPELFYSFYLEDSRRNATFLTAYIKNDNDELVLRETHVRKNIGHINSNGIRVCVMESDNAKVEEYINIVLERTYAENWAPKFEYSAGNFTDNELAILGYLLNVFLYLYTLCTIC